MEKIREKLADFLEKPWEMKTVERRSRKKMAEMEWLVEEVKKMQRENIGLTDKQLEERFQNLRKRGEKEGWESVLAEAFACVCSAADRHLHLRPYEEQIKAGAVLAEGKIAEQKTGEGKTLTATMPLAWRALEGKGCHLATVNDYLAKRDCQWMGGIYAGLGLKVGLIVGEEQSFIYDGKYKGEDKAFPHLRPTSRREAYDADITYGTHHEFGFDYLRDHLVYRKEDLVMWREAGKARGFHYIIIDEVDNILIDEARTPLRISLALEEQITEEYYRVFREVAKRLVKDEDYEVDEKEKRVIIGDEGYNKIEKILRIDNLSSKENYWMISFLTEALRAKELFKRDREYVVKKVQEVDKEGRLKERERVIIIDENTGRLRFDTRYEKGLHQAIEAKEGVEIKKEQTLFAMITLQNFFRMYKNLAGMTGTAATAAEEFEKIYGLEVVMVPEHKPLRRIDRDDLVFLTEEAKIEAGVKEIIERHKKGQPVLMGTSSVEKSEELAERLRREGIEPQVLNAKEHQKEGKTIGEAGRWGAVTVATQMAGRGVDIQLGGDPKGRDAEDWKREQELVKDLGGLFILGLERQRARRIDEQLRGRSGRQGDAGESRFYVSLEDELMIRFGGKQVRGLWKRMGVEKDVMLEHHLVSEGIKNCQIRAEGHDADLRKNLLSLDEVVNKQREYIYRQRREALFTENLRETVLGMMKEIFEERKNRESPVKIAREWKEKERNYGEWAKRFDAEQLKEKERRLILETIDNTWSDYLRVIDDVFKQSEMEVLTGKESKILTAFSRNAFWMFERIIKQIKEEVTEAVEKVMKEHLEAIKE